MLDKCNLCPRKCNVNRNESSGFCKEKTQIKLAKVALHQGEEPVLVGSSSSATFFFSSCTLKCPFCQNWQLSHFGYGTTISSDELANLMLYAQKLNASNINLVSATHFLPSINKAIIKAKNNGLSLPIVFNTGGYESLATLTQYLGMIDIYLPDLKTLNPTTSTNLYFAKDYKERTLETIMFMVDKKPLIYSDKNNTLLKQGVIVRHLVLPNMLDETYEILEFFSKYLKNKALLSLMTQYTPVYIPNEKREIPKRFLHKSEYDMLCAYLQELQIDEGFFQDLETDSNWLPDFEKEQTFDEKLAKTIWHDGRLL